MTTNNIAAMDNAAATDNVASPDGSRNGGSKVVLVTGASSGIGRGIAQRLAAEGHRVVAGARRLERLEALAGTVRATAHHGGDDTGEIFPVALDVTDRSSVAAFVQAAVDRFGRVDVLVNNAGVMPLSRLDSLLVGEWERMIDVNVRGLLYGIAEVLPRFQQQGGGHFVTMASVGAHQVVPTSAVYSGSKYAAWAITEGLRQESDPTIRVTTICPGVVTSELAESITEAGAAQMMKTYRAHAIEPDAIAQAVSYALGQPDGVDVTEIIVQPTRQR